MFSESVYRVTSWYDIIQRVSQNRTVWGAATRKGTEHFEKTRLQSQDQKRLANKRVPNPSTATSCQICRKTYASAFWASGPQVQSLALTRQLRQRRTPTIINVSPQLFHSSIFLFRPGVLFYALRYGTIYC